MNKFANAMREETTHTFTENGALAKNTSSDALVDLYSTIGALRNAEDERVKRLFDEAFKADKLLATKILFYGRDVRGGLGERKVFRTIIKHMATYHPEALRPNIDLIGVFGRYDDLYTLVDTPLEKDMWAVMKEQLIADIQATNDGKACSLLGKWIKSPDTSSPESVRLGKLTAKNLGYSVYDFKRILRKLRANIRVTESLMSTNRWSEIKYPEVPSRAMKLYSKAFRKHDEERFDEFKQKALTGEVKINSSTLYPYDIIESMVRFGYKNTGMGRWDGSSYGFIKRSDADVDILEAQWRQLPNYVTEGSSAIVMADTSGSMEGRPMNTAVGLAVYFAERNKGPFENMFLTFSESPKYHQIKGDTLLQKLTSLDCGGWDNNTDMEAAFNLILDTAMKNHLNSDDLPKALVVVSDMEFDYCGDRSWSFYETMRNNYRNAGYEIPTVIFWNVNSRHDVFHADANHKGVQLVSGQSTAVFKQLMANIGLTPYEAMLKVINSERYEQITIE